MTQLSDRSAGTPLEPPRGLALNCFRLICPGLHRMIRLPRPASPQERRRLEQSIGKRIFQAGDFGYTSPGASIPDSQVVDLECGFDRQLHIFDLRACISDQAALQKLSARFGFGGEIQITGFSGDVEIDGIRVQRRLRLRVIDDLPGQDTWIVGRHDTRYLVAGTLVNSNVRDHCIGEMAERLTGTGPPRGRILSASDEQVTLQVRDEQIAIEPSNYTIAVRSSYIINFYQPETLTKLQAASGSLTRAGQRNRYAIKDRYKALTEDMEQFGWTIAMAEDRYALIERVWTEIRIQAGSP